MKPLRLTAREAILEAACLVFGDRPSASLTEVAMRAGVGRATLHRHFRSREDLIRALFVEALDRTDQATASLDEAPGYRAALLQMFEAVIPLGSRYSFLRREPDLDDAEIGDRYQAQVDSLNGIVEGLKREGEIDPNVPTAWVTDLIDSLVWSGWSSMERDGLSANEAATLACRTVLHGLGPPTS